MQTEITLKDFLSFLKKYTRLIFITSILFFLAGSSIVAFQKYRSFSTSTKVDQNEEMSISNEELERLYNTDSEELTIPETEILDEYLLKDAYYFTALIEEPDYSPYNRANLINAFLVSDQVISQLEQEIGKEILPSPQQAIRNSYNQSNVLHTFTFTTGNRADNRALANAVFNLITNKELPILENRYVYIKDEPDLLELNTDIQDELEVASAENNSSNAVMSVILAGIASLILGMIFGIIFAFIREKISSKIGYLYTFPVNKQDLVIRYDKGTEIIDESVIHVIETPADLEKAVIVENMSQIDKVSKKLNNYPIIHLMTSIEKMAPNKKIEEAIVLINIEETSKKWFNHQMDILEIYDVKKKILVVDV